MSGCLPLSVYDPMGIGGIPTPYSFYPPALGEPLKETAMSIAVPTTIYPAPLIWVGTWKSPRGHHFNGHHVWDRRGRWVGVYHTFTRAQAEAGGYWR